MLLQIVMAVKIMWDKKELSECNSLKFAFVMELVDIPD